MTPDEVIDKLAYIKAIWQMTFTDESEDENIEALNAAIDLIEKQL